MSGSAWTRCGLGVDSRLRRPCHFGVSPKASLSPPTATPPGTPPAPPSKVREQGSSVKIWAPLLPGEVETRPETPAEAFPAHTTAVPKASGGDLLLQGWTCVRLGARGPSDCWAKAGRRTHSGRRPCPEHPPAPRLLAFSRRAVPRSLSRRLQILKPRSHVVCSERSRIC